MVNRSYATSYSRVNSLAACKVRVSLRNCLHPGFVATRFGDQSGGLISRLVWFAKFFAISPAQGAETIIYLASSPDVRETTGQYFYKSAPTMPSAAAQDDRSALLLWQRSAALAGMKE